MSIWIVGVEARLTEEEILRLSNEFVVSTFEEYADSVVVVTGEDATPSEQKLEEYFLKVGKDNNGSFTATGYFILPNGYVLANAHAIHGSVSQAIETRDGKRYDAEVVGINVPQDLALLKVNFDHPVKPITYREDSEVRQGEIVMAIGHPKTYKFSSLQGLITGKNRSCSFDNVSLNDVLQTNMPLYGGASGSPWFDLNQKVVSTSLAKERDVDNICLGISTITILQYLPQLFDFPHRNGFVRGFDVKLANGRCVVFNVDKESPAGKAGLQDGDIIESVNDVAIPALMAWLEQEEQFKAETAVQLFVSRGQNKQQVEAAFSFASWDAPDVNESLWNKIGLKVRPMTEDEIKLYHLKSPFALLITDVNQERFARFEHHPQPGDVLGKFAFIRPRDMEHLGRILDNLKSGDKTMFVFLRIVDSAFSRPVLDFSPEQREKGKFDKSRIDFNGYEVK